MTDPVGEPTAPSSFLDSIGTRARRRAEPRTSIALAGAGCALAVLGVLLVSGDSGASGDGSSFNKIPGVVLTALVVAGGFVVLNKVRQGPIATAGTVAAVLGVPPLMVFATFDEGSLPPWSTEGILVVSTIVWAVGYLVGPGRGRPLFLGAALFGIWASLLQLTEKVFDLPFTFFEGFVNSFGFGFEEESSSFGFGSGFGGFPDPTTVGMLSLGLGLAYLGVSRWLDRGGYVGVATSFLVISLPATFLGVLALSGELDGVGAGLLLVAVGVGLAWHGTSVGRRATTWIGGAAAAAGMVVFFGDLTTDATISGVLYLAAGIGMVAAGHALATKLDEPDEMALTEPEPRGPRPPKVVPPAPEPPPVVTDPGTE